MSEYEIFCALRIISGDADEDEIKTFCDAMHWPHGGYIKLAACQEIASLLARLNQDPNA